MLATILCSCINEPTLFTLKYTASEGGTIQGLTEQSVREGNDGVAVTAVANEGYKFVEWSDGLTTPFRQDTNITQDVTVSATFEKIVPPQPVRFTVKYLSSLGGSIQGQTQQTVEKGEDCSTVTAIANEGYEFVKWSDNITTAERQDKAISRNITITAIFKEIEVPEPLTKTYSLNYNFGEAEEKPEQITFVENEIESVTLPTLTREHFTFGGWYCGNTQVANTEGALLVGDELLTQEATEIYAKWTANETFTYKILLVYVTRIDAVLPHKNPDIKEKIHVDYTMSEQEREFCHLVTLRTKKYLDKMLDGLVDFQVDEYYTEHTFSTEDFTTNLGARHDSYLILEDIVEVQDMLPLYDSGLVLYNAYRETVGYSGKAYMKYGEVRLDGFMLAIEAYHSSLEQVIEMLKTDEDSFIGSNTLIDSYMVGTIVHELAHTIELRVNLYDYHNAVYEINYIKQLTEYETNRQYFLNEAVIDDNKVGIPYGFWKGELAKCSYYVTEDNIGCQGYVTSNYRGLYHMPSGSGNGVLEAVYGEYITVTAIPHKGYKFKCWSDGITTAERTDLVIGDVTVTAIFEKTG